MKTDLAKLATDFFSTIMFLAVYFTTTGCCWRPALPFRVVAQVVMPASSASQLGFMTYASLALVIVLGGADAADQRSALRAGQPAIAHFAIGAIMLKRGWMLRYMPPIVTETIPEYVTAAGYAWAALMFALGAGTIAIALTGDIKLWALYVSVVAIGAKIAAFAVQYVAFRILVTSRIRAARA